MSEIEQTRRLFFALWPSPELRQELTALAQVGTRRAGGRPVKEDNLHLTLAFLGSVTEAEYRCIREKTGEFTQTVQGFSLSMDRLGWFRRAGVAWLGCSSVPEPLQELVSSLEQVMRDCGLEPDSRPYQAHLTLRRRVRRPPGPLTGPSLAWMASEFVLVQSQTLPEGAHYEIVARWPLKPIPDEQG